MLRIKRQSKKAAPKLKNEAGFSLVEVVIAMLVMTVLLLGTLSVFTYAVQYNRGNNLRSQAMTVLQQEAELYRSAKFTASITDNYTPTSSSDSKRDITAGTKATRTVTSVDGNVFNVDITVDNDPYTTGIQTAGDSDKSCTLKEIKITVTPNKVQAAWQTAVVATLTMQRVRGN